MQDDEQQALLATDVIENQCSVENPAFVNEITLCEIIWVLKRAYRYDKSIILEAEVKFIFHRMLRHGKPMLIMKQEMLIFQIILLPE